jgi:hypothetical protein
VGLAILVGLSAVVGLGSNSRRHSKLHNLVASEAGLPVDQEAEVLVSVRPGPPLLLPVEEHDDVLSRLDVQQDQDLPRNRSTSAVPKNNQNHLGEKS